MLEVRELQTSIKSQGIMWCNMNFSKRLFLSDATREVIGKEQKPTPSRGPTPKTTPISLRHTNNLPYLPFVRYRIPILHRRDLLCNRTPCKPSTQWRSLIISSLSVCRSRFSSLKTFDDCGIHKGKPDQSRKSPFIEG